MTDRRHPGARATALAAVLSTAAALSVTPAHAAATDPVANNTHTYAVQLTIGDLDNRRHCSGALVDKEWVLTAASCFATDPRQPLTVAAGAPKYKTVATIGRTDLSATNGYRLSVVELVPRTDRNLVMARLSESVRDIAPVAVATTAPVAGETLRTLGYGRTATEWVPGRLNSGQFTVSETGTGTVDIASAGGSICKGDAGGPALRESGGQVELVGVHSTSWQGGCLNEAETRKNAVETRVDDIAGWILKTRFPQTTPLTVGTTLANGQTISSRGAKLTMTDGVLSLRTGGGNGAVTWSAGTSGRADAKAVMEAGGNLAICVPAATAADLSACASDTTKTRRLWSTNIPAASAGPNNGGVGRGGFAVLQDRGNLVVHNARGEALWSTGTAVRHDYNGDSRSDLALWYDYADGHDSLHTLLAGAGGAFPGPVQSYSADADTYWSENMKFTTGDYNGDGRGDVAAFYGYSDGRVKLFTFLSKADGGFNAPISSWSVPAGEWTFENMTARSGDFDGNGRDDVAVWYSYADGRDRLFTFTSDKQGGFNDPFSSWTGTEAEWNANKSKFVTGDFDADGRDDMAVLYDYGDTTVKLWTVLSRPDGGFLAPFISWTDTTWGDWARTGIHAGDFNGDGRDDVAAWYDYADGHDGVQTFTSLSTKDGAFQTPKAAWTAPAGGFWYYSMKVLVGDYNGDGRDDLAGIHDYTDGSMKTWTWTAKTDGTFNAPAGSWNPATGWNYDRVIVPGQHH